jgi:PAS domain S-box-containing protein
LSYGKSYFGAGTQRRRVEQERMARGRVKATRSSPTGKGRPLKRKVRKAAAKASVAALREQARSNAERFRLLEDTAAMPILLLAPDLKILEINAEAARLYGRGRGSLVGRDYFRALDPAARGGITRADFAQVIAGVPARGVEGRVRRADGTERVLLWNATRLLAPDGRPEGIIAVAQDITERQRAEEALREREARLSSIIATAPDAIITIDERGIVQSFSSAAEKLFGYAAGEAVGRNVSMLMPSPHREAHDGYLRRYLRTGEKRIIGIGREVEARHKDGTVFPAELAVGEARIGATRIFTGFIRDLTARARMEQELRQAQKMEAVGQLTGGLAHDFNNLLTVITGNLEMLEPRLERADDRELLREAQEAADLGAKLAGRLLAFGRRQPLNSKPIDLSALVAGMSDLLRRTLGASVEVDTRLAPGLHATMADPGQVENALLNLAINARDAMPGGGKLTIETAEAALDRETAHGAAMQAGGYVMLSVSDTGKGMSPEVRRRAFEPFFTTKGPGAGTGLGLSMVYGFVKQSGGHVQLASEEGKGTTVRIYLPAIHGGTAGAAAPQESAAAPAARTRTVLLVEDDPRVRKVTMRRLKQLGYASIESGDAPAALDALARREQVDLLFTDIVMPGGMSGFDLAREARKLRPGLKILFTSGYADQAATERGLLTENARWLAKPYRSEDLAAALRELLAG